MSGAHAAHAWDTDPAFLPPTSSPGHMYIGMELPEPIGYDVCVVGGGVMGSAAAWHLAKAGRSVSLIEAHPLKGHARGSSHGGSRITRRTDADPLLAAMATAAMAEWRAVETAAAAAALPSRGEALSAAPLYRRCGSLDMGDPLSAPGLAELIRTAREEAPPRGGAAFEILSGAQIRARWRGFAGVPLTWRGVFNRDGGVLAPDVAVPTLQALAVARVPQTPCRTSTRARWVKARCSTSRRQLWASSRAFGPSSLFKLFLNFLNFLNTKH